MPRRRPATPPPLQPASLPNARPAAMPRQPPPPQLATLAAQAPEGDQWLHEIKYDGYRMLGWKDGDRVRLYSRNGKDWTERLPGLEEALRHVSGQWIVDGEAVILDSDGTSSFQALQNAIRGNPRGIQYFVFDLLYCDGYDLSRVPLESRKQLLAERLREKPAAAAAVHYCEHIVGQGPAVFAHACELGVEGIISKRRDRPARRGRHPDWLKIKHLQRDDFLILGYTRSTARRQTFGALVLGYRDEQGRLHYAGKVGTGFSERALEELFQQLKSLRLDSSPLPGPSGDDERDFIWVRPELIAQVEYLGWSAEGRLRHPSFQGLRDDLQAAQLVQTSADASLPTLPMPDLDEIGELRFTHPDRLIYPAAGVTKLGLATYYAQVSHWMLPLLVRRPLALVRAPDGILGQTFFQKRAPRGLPESVRRLPYERDGESTHLLYVENLEGLLWLIQFNVVELHAWNCRVDKLDAPDRVIFDLDPAEGLGWSDVVRGATRLHERLDDLGLASFVKTTGGKGVHVVVPLVRRNDWETCHRFAQGLAAGLVREYPREYTLNPTRPARRGKIYLDIVRNVRGATSVAAYSTRARELAPVSAPVSWDELPALTGADQFRATNLPRRLAALASDPWSGIHDVRQSITRAALKRL